MVKDTASEILTILGFPAGRQEFFDLMKGFCSDSEKYKVCLDETKKFLSYFNSYLEDSEFQYVVYEILKNQKLWEQ